MSLRKGNSIFSTQFLHDERSRKLLYFALLLLVITTVTTLLYYLTYPQVDINADTPAYIKVVERFWAYPDRLVDPWRLPGYPLFIVSVEQFAGHNNLGAVSVAQAVLFVMTTLEIYIIALLIFRHSWLAFIVGSLVGTNLILVGYIKPIMTEGLAALLLTTLTLGVICFIRTGRIWILWFVTLCLLLLLFTRPEWVYLPVPLFTYLFLVVIRNRNGRQLLRYSIHATAALILIYFCVWYYVERNGEQNGYHGLVAIENYNWMGKVMQYDMQDEAPPEGQPISQELDRCITRIDTDPYHVLPCVPELSRAYDAPAGAFARSIIFRHPGEFLLKSLPYFFSSLIAYYDVPYHTGPIPGVFHTFLAWLLSLHRALYWLNAFFPACIVAWLARFYWRRGKYRQETLLMGAIILLITYGIVTTTLGGYRLDDYMRVHVVFDPLLILVIWGSLLMLLFRLTPLFMRRLRYRSKEI